MWKGQTKRQTDGQKNWHRQKHIQCLHWVHREVGSSTKIESKTKADGISKHENANTSYSKYTYKNIFSFTDENVY